LKKKEVTGNINGLKKNILVTLKELYDIRSDNSYYCNIQIQEILIKITSTTNREIAVFINKKGYVVNVFVGDFKKVVFDNIIEDNCICIHSHPQSSGKLSPVDIDTLENLHLKAMAAIGIFNDAIIDFYCAYINSNNEVINLGPINGVEYSLEIMKEINEFATCNRKSFDDNDERVIAVGINSYNTKANLDELEELIITAGGICVYKLLQNKERADNAFYIGKGKVSELKYLISEYNATTVCFDDPLNATQMRNIEQILNIKILDRSTLILDIFASRANSKEGKLQVELAQLNHLLPLLIGKGTQLSRLGGGIGTRGPGETKLETDRRHILKRINTLKKQLAEVEKRRENSRKERRKKEVYMVALAGYTNAGKSTLINKLTNSTVFEKDMLFATLDPSIRRLEISPSNIILFVDTVGFISKLPHELVDAFKSTLEEMVKADLILHVMDGSNDNMEEQAKVVYSILKEINATEVKIIEVINKIDLLDGEFTNKKDKIYISSKTGEGIPYLLKIIQQLIGSKKEVYVKIPYENGKLISYIHQNCEIITEEFEESYTLFKIRASIKILNHINNMNK